jgi:hypothetical protein
MRTWAEFKRRLHYLTRRKSFDSELADEIEFHIGARTEELLQAGLSEADANAQARREFGPQTPAS